MANLNILQKYSNLPNSQTEGVHAGILLLWLDGPTETQTLEGPTQEYEHILDTSDAQIPTK
jgi:hypothetical protein